jgi:exo-1,4-beta-D-glucosaminidase
MAQQNQVGTIPLRKDWRMQSSTRVARTGKEISMSSFNTAGWYAISLPSTVIAGLLKNNKYGFDPFYGNNLQKITGPEFDSSWWFRKQFTLGASARGRRVSVTLHGINYRANIWVNGELIADTNTVIGPFRIFEFDLSRYIKYGQPNALAIEVMRPVNPNKRGGDLAVDYADWIHYPADYNGGILNDVELHLSDEVAVRYPLVTTRFDLPSLATAHLDVIAEVVNYSDQPQDVLVEGKINSSIHFEQQVRLTARQIKQVVFRGRDYRQLNIQNPRIWWPWQYGQPQLNQLDLRVVRHQKTASQISEHFGIRQMSSEMIDNQSRVFLVNGKRILLRGAAWAPDIFQRRSAKRQEQEIRLVRDMHMNLIRSEGKLEDDHFYDLCDKYGLLVMTGWMCCGAWQYPEKWDSVKRVVAMESERSVMYWLRNKACLLVWLNGSDMPPKDTTVEKGYLQIEQDLGWPNPILSTADASVSKVSGYSGVKMNGPYDWVPPIYWETDSGKRGGAWSFATEISPGPSIPPYESLVKFIPEDSLSVKNSQWLYHCGTMQFGTTSIFNDALEQRYGPSQSVKEYISKAQAQNYEGHRAMMEAFGLNKYQTATGVVQWMLSNPWPSLIWHTYDYYLYPAGTYFGIKKSLEPLHVQYSYKSREVIVNNSYPQSFRGLVVRANIYNLDGALKYADQMTISVSGDAIHRCFVIPEFKGLDSLYFLRLQLRDSRSKTISINWYWLSKKDDSLNWAGSKWFYTPQSSFANYTDLRTLTPTALRVDFRSARSAASMTHTIRVTNIGSSVAFFVHLRMLKGKKGEDILPVLFDDNYLLLAPGETREITCSYQRGDAGNAVPYLLTSAWNLDMVHSKAKENLGFVREMP